MRPPTRRHLQRGKSTGYDHFKEDKSLRLNFHLEQWGHNTHSCQVKVDNCRYGSWADLVASQRAMSAALRAAGRPMVIQIGAGDHMPLLRDPNASAAAIDASYPRTPTEQAWVWGPQVSTRCLWRGAVWCIRS